MAQAPSHYLGMDFGTSNSYLACVPCNMLNPNPVEIDGKEIVSTAILLSSATHGPRVLAFGSKALGEWGGATPKAQSELSLRLNFKADMAASQEAWDSARMFLSCVARDIEDRGKLPGGLRLVDVPFFVGVPAETLPGHEDALRLAAREAGFGKTTLVKEPVGAVVHHLVREDIPVADVQAGVLVIDFGGGTLDVAFLHKLRVAHAWGDPELGGRLFDDLFYQWVCELNDGLETRLAGNRTFEYSVHWDRCREAKENFSRLMARDRQSKFDFTFTNGGLLENACWRDFEERAQDFTYSRTFRELLPLFGVSHSNLADAKGIDLLQRVREAIGKGFCENKVSVTDVRWIILTGGSSAWPFVKDILTEDIGIDAKKILASANAGRAVGEGIAMLPVYKARNRTNYGKMRQEKPEIVSEATGAVMDRVKEFMESIVTESVSEFFESDMRPCLERFRKNGGRIVDLRKELKDCAPRFESNVGTRVEGRRGELEAAIKRSVVETFSRWFQARDVEWDPAAASIGLEELGSLEGADLSEIGFDGATTVVVSIVVGIVTAELLGGGGIALLMSGPIGWFIGLVLGALAVLYGKTALEGTRIPAWTARLVICDKGINALQGKIESAAMKQLGEALDKKRTVIESAIERFAGSQIKALEALDDL